MPDERLTKLVHCDFCNGRGRRQGKRCAKCGGSGRLWVPVKSEPLAAPAADAPAVHVLSMTCPNCGREEAPSEAARLRRYNAADFEGKILCSKCFVGRITFELEPA